MPRARHEEDGAPTAPRFLSLDEAARYLGLGSRGAVRGLVVNDALPVVRIAGKLRLDVDDLDQLVGQGECSASEPVMVPPAATMREDIERTSFSDRDQFEAVSPAARCGGAHRLFLLSHRLAAQSRFSLMVGAGR